MSPLTPPTNHHVVDWKWRGDYGKIFTLYILSITKKQPERRKKISLLQNSWGVTVSVSVLSLYLEMFIISCSSTGWESPRPLPQLKPSGLSVNAPSSNFRLLFFSCQTLLYSSSDRKAQTLNTSAALPQTSHPMCVFYVQCLLLDLMSLFTHRCLQ